MVCVCVCGVCVCVCVVCWYVNVCECKCMGKIVRSTDKTQCGQFSIVFIETHIIAADLLVSFVTIERQRQGNNIAGKDMLVQRQGCRFTHCK